MISLRSSSRFPLNSGARVESPVMFPPGRARLATKPSPTGSVSCAMTMGIVEVAPLAARVARPAARDDNLDFETYELGRERWKTIQFFLCRSPLNEDALSLNVTEFPKTLPQTLHACRDSREVGAGQVSYPRDFRWLLRLSVREEHREHGAKRDVEETFANY